MEEGNGRRDYEIPFEDKVLDVGVTEADIPNADPRCEFDDDQGQDVGDNATTTGDPNDPLVIVDGPEGEGSKQ